MFKLISNLFKKSNVAKIQPTSVLSDRKEARKGIRSREEYRNIIQRKWECGDCRVGPYPEKDGLLEEASEIENIDVVFKLTSSDEELNEFLYGA